MKSYKRFLSFFTSITMIIVLCSNKVYGLNILSFKNTHELSQKIVQQSSNTCKSYKKLTQKILLKNLYTIKDIHELQIRNMLEEINMITTNISNIVCCSESPALYNNTEANKIIKIINGYISSCNALLYEDNSSYKALAFYIKNLSPLGALSLVIKHLICVTDKYVNASIYQPQIHRKLLIQYDFLNQLMNTFRICFIGG